MRSQQLLGIRILLPHMLICIPQSYGSLNGPGSHGYFGWEERDRRTGQSWLSLDSEYIALGHPGDLTYGEFVAVMAGLNHVRLDYPILDIYAQIEREGDREHLADLCTSARSRIPSHQLSDTTHNPAVTAFLR